MCWQDITGPHTQAHFFHHFLSSESFSPPSCPPWQLSFCMSWRLSLPSSLAKGIWIQHRASWPPTSPVSSCQIKKSQQVRFKPCFSKRQCSFGQQPCPQPPASPESDTPFLCQKKCYRAVWFPPGDLPPSWGLKSRKSCAWNAQCDSFSKHTPLQEQINFIVTWIAKTISSQS